MMVKISKLMLVLVVIVVFFIGIVAGLYMQKPAGINPIAKPETNTQGCVYEGRTYYPGDSFPSIDGCNSCGCDDGQIVCTTMACVDN
jgi:hypothetical protein